MMTRAEPARGITPLGDAIETFIAYIRSLPTEALEPATGEEWGPREVLCHLVFWHEENATILDAALKGTPHALLAGGVHENNARAVALNQGESIEGLCKRWREAQARIEGLLAGGVPAGMRFASRQGSTVRPVEEAFRPGHVLGHLRQLQRRRG